MARQAAQRKVSPEQAADDYLQRYRFNPNLFAAEVLRVKLDPWQVEANEAVADYVRFVYGRDCKIQRWPAKGYFTVRAMHGPGKTFWGAQLILWFGSVFPGARIPIIAPKFQQITTRMMLDVRKIRAGAVPDFQRMTEDIGQAYVRWFGETEWVAFGQTAAKADNLSGLHNEHQLIFVDEASGVSEHLFPTIFGALSTGRVQILVLIGNPTRNAGTFAESHRRVSVAQQFHQIHITLDKAPRVSRAWVDRMVAKYGPSSPIVKIRCFGEFAEMGELQLVSPEWLIEARDRAEAFMAGDGSIGRLRVSVDVADGGEDKSVVTVCRHFQTRRIGLKQRSFSFEGGKVTAALAEEAIKLFLQFGGNKGADDFVVDANCVGAGVHDYLVRKGYRVIRFMGGAGSADTKRWRNRRVQSYMALRDDLRDGHLAIAPNFIDSGESGDESDESSAWDEFDAQMCSILLNPGTDRVEDLVSKQDMKRDGLKSPDRADSLMMQYATTAPTLATAGVTDGAKTLPRVMVHKSTMWDDMNVNEGGRIR